MEFGINITKIVIFQNYLKFHLPKGFFENTFNNCEISLMVFMPIILRIMLLPVQIDKNDLFCCSFDFLCGFSVLEKIPVARRGGVMV